MMTVVLSIVGTVLVMVAAALAVWIARVWLRAQGARVVTCPETRRPAEVELDAGRAVRAALVGESGLRLHDCSRWPERAGCGQGCLAQVEAAPDGCLVRTIVDGWYRGRSCAACGAPFGKIHWHDHRPALLDPEGHPTSWETIAPEQVPAALATHRPLCWDCSVAETFRERFPERVTTRVR